MDKRKIIIYCGEDGAAGKAEGLVRRDADTVTSLACCYAFDGVADPCERVVIMPDVPEYRRDAIIDAYTCKVEVMRDRTLPAASGAMDGGYGLLPPRLAAEIVANQGPNAKIREMRKRYEDNVVAQHSIPIADCVELPMRKRGRPRKTSLSTGLPPLGDFDLGEVAQERAMMPQSQEPRSDVVGEAAE